MGVPCGKVDALAADKADAHSTIVKIGGEVICAIYDEGGDMCAHVVVYVLVGVGKEYATSKILSTP